MRYKYLQFFILLFCICIGSWLHYHRRTRETVTVPRKLSQVHDNDQMPSSCPAISGHGPYHKYKKAFVMRALHSSSRPLYKLSKLMGWRGGIPSYCSFFEFRRVIYVVGESNTLKLRKQWGLYYRRERKMNLIIDFFFNLVGSSSFVGIVNLFIYESTTDFIDLTLSFLEPLYRLQFFLLSVFIFRHFGIRWKKYANLSH